MTLEEREPEDDLWPSPLYTCVHAYSDTHVHAFTQNVSGLRIGLLYGCTGYLAFNACSVLTFATLY